MHPQLSAMGLGSVFSRFVFRAALAGLLAASPAWLNAQTPVRVLYDLGSSGTGQVTPSPTTYGVFWNNVTNYSLGNIVVTNSVATNGILTGIRMSFKNATFDQVAPAPGTTNNPFYPATATKDGFMITSTNKVVTMQLDGLAPNATCDCTFFSSHNVMSNSTIRFVSGTDTQQLTGWKNATNTVTLSVQADTGGVARISISAVSNTPGQVYAILNVMDINYSGASSSNLSAQMALSTYSLVMPSMTAGSAGTVSNSFLVGNMGAGNMNFSVSDNAAWVSETPTSGSSSLGAPVTVSVYASASTLTAGTYTSLVTISSGDATNSPQTVQAVFNVMPQAVLSLTPSSLSNVSTQGANVTYQMIAVRYSGSTAPMGFVATIPTNAPWLSFSPAPGMWTRGGTTTTNYDYLLNLYYLSSSLTAGTYTSAVTVTAVGASNSPQQVSVRLTVSNNFATVTNIVLSPPPGTYTGSVSVAMSCATTGATIRYTLNNSTPSTASPVYTTPILFSTASSTTVRACGFADDMRPGPLVIGAYTVKALPVPAMALNTTSLSQTPWLGVNASNNTFQVWNSGTGTLNYAISADQSWLTPSPAGGVSTGQHDTITLSYDTTGLGTGSYTGLVTVSSDAVTNPTKVLSMRMTVLARPVIELSTNELSQTVAKGVGPASRQFTVRNGGGSYMAFSVTTDVAWAWANPVSGISSGEARTNYVNFQGFSGMASGVYTGHVIVTAAQATNSPQLLTLLVTVLPGPQLAVAPDTLTNSVAVGHDAASQAFEVWNSGGAALSFSVATNADWLSAAPSCGISTGEHATVTLAYRTAGLSSGVYMGGVTVSANGAGAQPQTVTVRMAVTGNVPVLASSPASLDFSTYEGSSPAPATFQVWNAAGGSLLTYSVSSSVPWLAVSPAAGSSSGEPTTITVTPDTATNAPGTYTATIQIFSADALNSPLTLPVTVKVTAAPAIGLSTNCLWYSVPAYGAAWAPLYVRNTGGGALDFTAAADAPWAWVSPASGMSTGQTVCVWVNVSATNLASGSYTTTLALACGDAANSPQPVTVAMTVRPPPAIGVSPSSITRTVAQGAIASNQLVYIRNLNAADTMPYTATPTVSWLTVAPAAGTLANSQQMAIQVGFACDGLGAGTYSGAVLMASAKATNSPLAVPVTLTIQSSAALIARAPSMLNARVTAGAGTSFGSGIQVWNAGRGGGTMEYTLTTDAAWLVVPPEMTSGVSTGQLVVHAVVFTNTGALGVGAYTGHVMIASAQASNTPQSVLAVLTVDPARPGIALSPSSASLEMTQGDPARALAFDVWNAGSATPMGFTVQSTAPGWLSAQPAYGSSAGDPVAVTATVSVASLAAGSYDGALTITAPSATNSPLTMWVHLSVAALPSVIACTPSAMTVTAAVGNNAATQQLWISNAGTGAMAYVLSADADWLTVSAATGMVAGVARRMHTAMCRTDGLAEGTYNGTVSIEAEGAVNTPYALPVTLQVQASLGSSPASLTFAAAVGTDPPAQTLQVWNAGSANPVDYVLQPGAAWLSVTPTNGTSAGELDEITVGCAASNLVPGAYTAFVDLVPAAGGAVRRIPVQLTVQSPVGVFQERIVFARYVPGGYDIWSCTPDGSNLMPVVIKSGTQMEPRVSPDGLKLAYRDLYALPYRTIVRDLATGVESQYMDLIAFDWTGDSRALIGENNASVTNDLYKVGLDGSVTRLFVEGDRQTPFGVDWNSGRVYYATDPGSGCSADVRVYDPSTSNRTTIRPRDSRSRTQGNVSCDGRLLCYLRSGSPQAIYTCSSDGSNERQIGVDGNAGDQYPDFSPDGSQVLFCRSNRIYRAPVSGPALQPTLVADGTNNFPCWSVMLVRTGGVPRISVMPPYVFAYATVGSNAFYPYLRIANMGGGRLAFTVSNDVPWCAMTPTAGVSYGSNDYAIVRLNFYTAGMAVGRYTGSVWVAAADATNSPVRVFVFLTVNPPAAGIDVWPAALSNSCVQGYNADNQTLQIRNVGGMALSYSLATNVPWLAVSPVSGSSTGETDTITVAYRTAGLPLGLLTGMVTVSGSATNSPKRIPVCIQVLPPPEGIPSLGVSPTLLTNGVAAGGNAPHQAFVVQNTGGGTLDYTITDNVSWLTTFPSNGTSMGEQDAIGVDYITTGLAAGTNYATIKVAGAGVTQAVEVVLTVGPGPTYALTIATNPSTAGYMTVSPAPGAGGRYAAGTNVWLTAYPYADYLFDYWSGTVISTARTISVRMNGDAFETANFHGRTCFGGYVTNLATGAAVKGAQVFFGATGAVTSASGYYWFRDVPSLTSTLRVSRVGYADYLEAYSPPAFTSTVKNIGLTPAFVGNVRASARPGSALVDVYYDLAASTGDCPWVSLAFSSGGGGAWDITPSTLAGDAGSNILAGVNRHIVWNAGVDWPGLVSSSMVARVSAGGATAASPPFALSTLQQGAWTVRVWADRNRNGTYDANEGLAGAEVFYDGRAPTNLVGVTDEYGYLGMSQAAQAGRSLFARKRLYAQPACKGGHAAVSNLMYTLWMDSDMGGADSNVWDGTWRAYTLSDADVSQAQSGGMVSLPLAHPVFQWHLLVACQIASTSFVAQVKQSLTDMSALLYDATDGQMKLGMVAIASGAAFTNAYRNADLVINSMTLTRPNAPVLGMQVSNGCMSAGATLWNGAAPGQPAYGQYLTRVFCMYALGLYPEDADGNGNRSAWSQYRAQHPDEVPGNYGIMDDPFTASELSSYNKYLSFYPPKTNAYKVTQQLWMRGLNQGGNWAPCWQFLEQRFQRAYSNVWVEIVTPQRGGYAGNNQSTTDDRPGPTFISAPYTACAWADVPGSGYGVLAVRTLAPSGGQGAALRVLVTQDGRPAAGAELLRQPAAGSRPLALGRTDAAGAVAAYDIAAGDGIEVTRRGAHAVYTVTPVDLYAETASIALPSREGAPRTRGFTPLAGGGTLAAGRVGVVVSGRLQAAPRTLQLTFQTDHELAGVPVVTNYLDNGSSAAVTMTAGGGHTYTGALSLADSAGGTLDIQCPVAGGGTERAVAGFDIGATSTNDTRWLTSPSGRATLVVAADSVASTVEGVVYEGDLPVILPSGGAPTNAVGPVVFVALADDACWNGNVALQMSYQDADLQLPTLDESSLRLCWWDAAATNWIEVQSSLSLEKNAVDAAIAQPGAYALFADASADTNAPAAITDLVASSGTNGSAVELTWTAVGDDDFEGLASLCQIRYSTAPIANWDEGTAYTMALTPAAPGETERVVLQMSAPNTMYYFVVRAVDEAGNAGMVDYLNVAAARSSFVDTDGDGMPDDWEVTHGLNPLDPSDADEDPDVDGLTSMQEYQNGSNPRNADTDGDGMSDGWEVAHGLNPLDVSDAAVDADGDGLTNLQEYQRGTNPRNTDTDGDGIPDGWEYGHQMCPFSGSGDNGETVDSDDDGFSNYDEFVADTDPYCATSRLQIVRVWIDNGTPKIDFQSSCERSYDILDSSSLTNGEWLPLIENKPGDAGATTVTDTNAPSGPVFYRVHVRAPAP